jgi:hypothetical protein
MLYLVGVSVISSFFKVEIQCKLNYHFQHCTN